MVMEPTIKAVIREVASGLKFCHQNGVLHRDIKPQNIIFTADHHAKLIDFGVSKVLDDPNGSDVVKQTEGTYHFMSPEMCDPDIDECSGKAADVWALGVTLYTLMFEKCPFWGQTDYQLMESIRNDPMKECERQVSPELMAILNSLLNKDPTQRATLEDLLSNPWLNTP